MKRYTFSLLLVAFIVVVSLIPIPETQLKDIPFYDKWTHFIMYGTLSLTVWWEYLSSHSKVRWSEVVIVAILLPVAVSGLLELAQAYLTTCRSGDWLDFAANGVGVLLATLLASLYLYIRKQN